MLRSGLISIFIAMMALVHSPAKADEALVNFKMLNLETALELAQATLKSCQDDSFQVAVSVVDRFGNLQVTLRDRFAGPHTTETARRKAWTAVSFRTDTVALSDLTQVGKPQSGVRFIPGALMAGGGVPVEAAGSIVAGVGVSGAPGGELDDKCARDGIEAIADKLF
ncbi:MAG: heme-binding protein [Rhodospirillales bacterium]|nr:heme-binding protein [Rhodospirillales bacterium]